MNHRDFKLSDHLARMIVDLHREISSATENCNPKSIPRDIVDIEIALAKSEPVRASFKMSIDDDENSVDITKIVPRHKIEEQTKFRKRLFLMSAKEIDTLPVCVETKATILGAQVEFIKALRRLHFRRAYELYTYIRLWKSKT